MFVQLDLSHSRRRRRWWLLPLVLAAVLLAGPWLAAVVPGTAASIGRFVGARYTAQIDALQAENFTLHQQLARSADALAENDALRRLVGCGRVSAAVAPARVLARGVGGFTLACPGAVSGARRAGRRRAVCGHRHRRGRRHCTVALVRTAGLCGAYAGLVTPGIWQLTGLPADCGLVAGDVVTTPSGDWLGTLAAAPMPDTDGLTASAALADTADLCASVYFVKK